MGSRIFCVRILAKCTRVHNLLIWCVVRLVVIVRCETILLCQKLRARGPAHRLSTARMRCVGKYNVFGNGEFVFQRAKRWEGRVSTCLVALPRIGITQAQTLVKIIQSLAPKIIQSIHRMQLYSGAFVFVVRATHLEGIEGL
ncbi:Hypothetical_protein [Hexamita inflata]|uniref:Hypothetical_protein n=1 Tax=Hexamita inflata TaxID=28002 RepID=A0AA86QYG2_9EUKA|nr:Hypothetical protein HINF_LOCUS56076 [Hexamita inflata]